jgi:hypothetical protein
MEIVRKQVDSQFWLVEELYIIWCLPAILPSYAPAPCTLVQRRFDIKWLYCKMQFKIKKWPQLKMS